MTDDEFKKFALMELANQDTLALVAGIRDRSGLLGAGIKEILRLIDAQKSFPGMSLTRMWEVDRLLSDDKKSGRPSPSDLQRLMIDPAWAAVTDLEKLKRLWREVHPTKQVPLELLTDIAVTYRDVDRATVVARRSRPKTRRVNEN